MHDTLATIISDLQGRGGIYQPERTYDIVVPYSESFSEATGVVRRNFVAYRHVLAPSFPDAKQRAISDVQESCFSAKLSKNIFTWNVNENHTRRATPYERKKYFARAST